MGVFKNRCLLGFLGRAVGRIALKIRLEDCKNITKRSTSMENFYHSCSLKNQSPPKKQCEFIGQNSARDPETAGVPPGNS